jgi:hypothetical protein
MTATGTATGRGRVAILLGFALVGGLLVDLISGLYVWGGFPIHQFCEGHRGDHQGKNRPQYASVFQKLLGAGVG